ncbi:MAG: FAD:protein FMN transferase [Bacteroidales bacterium]|nr:FAD:protein FMN transferase [Bacteroidales bacterium]
MRGYKIFGILVTMLLLLSCTDRGRYLEFSGYAQGGLFRVKYNSSGVSLSLREIRAGVDSILTQVDTTLSGYNRGSVLSRFNAGEPADTSGMFSELLSLCRKYYALTEGAFDVGSAPVFDLWGFGFTADSLPSAERLDSALVESKKWKKLNFNAIAQGYTCDLVASYLRACGVRDMLVDIGEIYCSGLNPDGSGWSIGIDNPVDGNNEPGKDMRGIWNSAGESCGIVTSGNYRKFYIRDGRKYSHTIDPRTGYPVTHGLLSATIVAPTAAEADAIATYCMVIGPEEAREFILSADELEACLISSDSVWTSPGFTLN